MKYLIVVAHPDDEVLGAGASILYHSLLYKTPLVEEINGKTIEVFVKEEKYFQYFGCYKMVDPYVEVSGAGRVLRPETPLEFIYDME